MSENTRNFTANQHTEIQRLQHMLHIEDKETSYLQKLDGEELFHLRSKIADALQNEHAETWEKLAKVSKFMPNFINAKIAQDILGASITANFTYFIPIKDALNISSMFSIPFMADVSEHLNPSRLEPLLKEFPIDRIKKIVVEMEKRNGYYTMGNFVDYIPSDKVSIIANQIQSEETLIRTASFANKKHRLAPIIAAFSDDRLKKLLLKGDELKLYEEIILIMRHIPDNELPRYLGILISIGGSVFQNYLNALKASEESDIQKIKKALNTMGVNIEF
ncbi:MAG: hypothetical protein H7A25_15390 [Leptospiraceae bacterium]|nr:hypothetical protein [Leptospiraceae bacterium]MCP5501283.1 hypothetical protein [Leptospiraceae bacterium]